MADKKITALTELAATGKNAAADFLHIIDFSASPVNKKITVASLFSNANTDTHIYGVSKTFEIGSSAAASSAIKVTTGSLATLTAAAGRKNEVIINDNGVAYIDFKVKSKTSDQALVVDADADTVTINGDSTVLDFVVKGDTTTLIHADGGLDAVGIGTASPDTGYTMTVAATGTNGIKSAGSVDVTGDITATGNASITGNLTVTGFLTLNDAIATALVGGADTSNDIAIPITDLVTHLNPSVSGNTDFYDIANGAAGQIKILVNTAAPANSAIITPANAHGGTTITLEGYETAMLMYTGTLGWAVIGTQGAAVG
jgi:hypothetical protein